MTGRVRQPRAEVGNPRPQLVESFSKGQVKQGAVEAFGSALNTAGAAFKSTFTPTPAEKLGNDPW